MRKFCGCYGVENETDVMSENLLIIMDTVKILISILNVNIMCCLGVFICGYVKCCTASCICSCSLSTLVIVLTIPHLAIEVQPKTTDLYKINIDAHTNLHTSHILFSISLFLSNSVWAVNYNWMQVI